MLKVIASVATIIGLAIAIMLDKLNRFFVMKTTLSQWAAMQVFSAFEPRAAKPLWVVFSQRSC